MKTYKLHAAYGVCSETFNFTSRFVLVDGAEVIKEYGFFRSFFMNFNFKIEVIDYGHGHIRYRELWEDLERGTISFLEAEKGV